MTPDTLEGSIHDLTQNILADYTAGRPIDRIEPFNQPDRDVIIALIGKLRRIVFPGYFRDPAYHVYSAAHSLSALIEDTAYLLQKQIAIALRCGSSVTQEAAADIDRQAQEMTVRFLEKIPDVRALLATDLQAFYDGDPAATSLDEIIIAYPGLLAITVNRLAHELFLLKVPLIPRIMTEYAHGRTGIDIHPGATIGKYFFIDHGTGIVVGETTIIGDSVKLYQGVTLGALSTRGGQSLRGHRRHPTIGDRVTIYSGASVLGGDTVIGQSGTRNADDEGRELVMVVGIRFAADAPVRTVLQAVLPIFPTADVDFLVREYWVCTFGNGLPERRFTAQEMRRAVDALTPDEHAELFTIYVLPHDAPDTPPSSCEDFCARGFTMAFYAYDGDGYALLAQSEEQVEAVIKTLRKAVEIRSVEAVERETLARWAF